MSKFSDKNPYLLLWLLLAVALVVFIIISFREESVSIGNLTLKQGTFKDQLMKEPDTTDVMEIDTVPLQTEKPVEPDSTIKSILVIGDSNTVLVDHRLAYYGVQNGYKVTAVTWDGSSSSAWSKTDKFDEGMAAANPDFIFISLGGNECKGDPSNRMQFVKKLVERFGDIPFVWLGPGGHISTPEFDAAMEKTLPKNTYFYHNMQLELKKDHIHPTIDGAKVWIDSVMRWMPKSAHPILSEVPDSSIKRAPFHHIYYNVKEKRQEVNP